MQLLVGAFKVYESTHHCIEQCPACTYGVWVGDTLFHKENLEHINHHHDVTGTHREKCQWFSHHFEKCYNQNWDRLDDKEQRKEAHPRDENCGNLDIVVYFFGRLCENVFSCQRDKHAKADRVCHRVRKVENGPFVKRKFLLWKSVENKLANHGH